MRCVGMNRYCSTLIACHALRSTHTGSTHSQRLQLHTLLAGQAALRELVDDPPTDVAGAQASQPRVQALLQRMRPLSACLLRQWAKRPSQRGRVFPRCGESPLKKAAQILTEPAPRKSMTGAHTSDALAQACFGRVLWIHHASARQQA